MNNDFRISTSFKNSTKRKKLHRILGPDAVLCLVDLWAYAAENRPLGALVNMTADDIEIAADWNGKPGVFISSLVDLRWLDFDGEIYHIHNWKNRNPWAFGAEMRSKRAKSAAEKRWKNAEEKTEEKQTVNAKSMLGAMQSVNTGNAPSPPPSPSPLPPPLPLPIPKSSSITDSSIKPVKGTELESSERMIFKEIEKIHFLVFGYPITPAEKKILNEFSEPEILKKYQLAQERIGTPHAVCFFRWITNGLTGGNDGATTTSRGFFSRFKTKPAKQGKISAAYQK